MCWMVTHDQYHLWETVQASSHKCHMFVGMLQLEHDEAAALLRSLIDVPLCAQHWHQKPVHILLLSPIFG